MTTNQNGIFIMVFLLVASLRSVTFLPSLLLFVNVFVSVSDPDPYPPPHPHGCAFI
jgi:hypothetical protein